MLETLYSIHTETVRNVPSHFKRYLYNNINWESRALCIRGARGVGKTTLLLQYYHEKYGSPEKCLYISADNLHVAANGLYDTAREYFKYGGEALIIDEIHKYPEWSVELKNILDTFRQKQILVSGSSSLNLIKGKSDLSRRLVYHELKGLSFREFLELDENVKIPSCKFSEIISNHTALCSKIIEQTTILKSFKNYLDYGYYPFFVEDKQAYTQKVLNIIEKTIFEDVAAVFNISQTKIPAIKKLLWLISTSSPFTPNIDKLSRELAISREYVYHYIEYLAQAGIITNLYSDNRGFALIRKPGKILMENPSLLNAAAGHVNAQSETGTMRETFFANQVSPFYTLNLHDKVDFIVEKEFIIEVGGTSKKPATYGIKDLITAIDNIEIGSDKRIPLYLFGFLY